MEDVMLELQALVAEHFNTKNKTITLKKKEKRLVCGDIVIPKGVLKKDVNKTDLQEIIQKLNDRLEKAKLPIAEIQTNDYNVLVFFFRRPEINRLVLSQVEEKGKFYGFCRQEKSVNVILHQPTVAIKPSSLSELRVALTTNHISKLLEANGYAVTKTFPAVALDVVERLCVDQELSDVAEQISEANLNSDIYDMLLQRLSPFTSSNGTSKEVDFSRLLSTKGFSVGNGGYDKNIDRIQVESEKDDKSLLLSSAAKLVPELYRASCEKKDNILVHVVQQCESYHQQQLMLILSAVGGDGFPDSQSLAKIGRVTPKHQTSQGCELKSTTAQLYCRQKYKQMKAATEARQLEDCQGKVWHNKVIQLTKAAITVDFLANTQHTELVVDVSLEEPEKRLGAFILYNTARLSALLARFHKQVQDGFYPQLPSLECVDFTLLREEEEWEILYVFISGFPDVVSQTVSQLLPTDGNIYSKIQTHKVVLFLSSFSKCLSSYYSRYHILGGCESHLVPLMFARIYLMRSAFQVLVNGLGLLDITALDYL